MHYLPVVLCSFLLGVVFLIFFKRLASRCNILTPNKIPLIGGIGMGSSFILTCLAAFIFYKTSFSYLIGIIISASIMLAFGIFDDKKELSVRAKFIAQIVSVSLLILFGVRTNIVYLGGFLNIIITFIWVIGITNAFNLLDIMDGLAGGIAVIVSLSFAVISFLNGDMNVFILSLALAGATLSFLIYNLPPAKIYMGNSGSHFLGFTLAAIALIISYASLESKAALLSPLVILGFPIFDTAFLILMRLRKKKLPFHKSNDHLALRFLALGYSKARVLLIMLSLGLFFSASGVIISRAHGLLISMIIIFVLFVSIIVTGKMSRVSIHG
ncbi:MAG: undecaprenyl/decaprenyl-phosphate alpha-N-acetylglucosaminyl 1-phosphate transferase [Candidatus Omnitrophica bacterium]|nr:undecaprenyl/decaprenyl-phosphate alpha-N-acetylglucosaminyl 1-phosphate transferase [Candidatus Omnitrophota bacterium]